VIRCEKCGGDIDIGGHCARCGQPPVTYTSNVPAAPQWGAIEEACRLLDEHCSPGFSYGCVPQARAELAALQADNVRMRGFIETVSLAPTPEDPQARLEGIVARARQALSTPAPAVAVVTLEQLREIEWANRGREENSWCPACGGSMALGEHDDDCWLAAALRKCIEGGAE